MKQYTSPPHSRIRFLLIPEAAIWVSVTMEAPLFKASTPICAACSEKHRLSA